MSKKGGSGASFQKDVPWRASSSTAKPFPKIHHSPLLRVSQTPFTDYAVSVMRHPDPIGSGLGDEAIVEAAGPDCLVPGQKMPLQLLGLQGSLTVVYGAELMGYDHNINYIDAYASEL